MNGSLGRKIPNNLWIEADWNSIQWDCPFEKNVQENKPFVTIILTTKWSAVAVGLSKYRLKMRWNHSRIGSYKAEIFIGHHRHTKLLKSINCQNQQIFTAVVTAFLWFRQKWPTRFHTPVAVTRNLIIHTDVPWTDWAGDYKINMWWFTNNYAPEPSMNSFASASIIEISLSIGNSGQTICWRLWANSSPNFKDVDWC